MAAGENRLVSVIIPTYNNAGLLPYTLESVLGQSYSPLEIIVVNDGATDETAQVLERFRSHGSLRIWNQSNQGDIAARNKGIELSKGDYVAFCDSDDLWNKDHVRFLVDKLERHPEVGLAFDNVMYFVDETKHEETVGAVVPEEKWLLVKSSKAKQLAAAPVPVQDIYTENLITTSCFMVPKGVFGRVGMFDKNIYLMNDLHLFYRIAAYYPIYYVDYVGVQKRVHATNLSVVNRHYEYGVKCLENIRECYPEVYRRIGKGTFDKKLGRKYFRLGLYYEKNGETDKAKEMYKKALLTRRLSFRYYWDYFRLGLGGNRSRR